MDDETWPDPAALVAPEPQPELGDMRVRLAIRLVDGSDRRRRLPPSRPLVRAARSRAKCVTAATAATAVALETEEADAGLALEHVDAELAAELRELMSIDIEPRHSPKPRVILPDDQLNAIGIDSNDAHNYPEVAAARFREQGMLRVRGAAPVEACARLCHHVDQCLKDAIGASHSSGELASVAHFFGQIYSDGSSNGREVPLSQRNRWDLFLRLDPPVLSLLRGVLASISQLLADLLTADALVCELATLITDGGAQRQPLHPDTILDGGAGLATCFVALQDVSLDMGPTLMIPRSHRDSALHELLGGKADRAVREAELGAMAGPTVCVRGETLPVQQCIADAGDVVLMDSRLLHCGGANVSGCRRRLLYLSLQVPSCTRADLHAMLFCPVLCCGSATNNFLCRSLVTYP
eukprot:SAG11_NODE_1282_length_5310_cov_24.980426_5_plen_410_part_00